MVWYGASPVTTSYTTKFNVQDFYNFTDLRTSRDYFLLVDRFLQPRIGVFTARSEPHHNAFRSLAGKKQAALRLRALVAGLSALRHRFEYMSVHVTFVEGKVVLGQVFLRVLQFLHMPQMILTHLFIYTLLLPGQTGEIWDPSKKQCPFGKR
jgi:hypothetical protein